MAHRVTVRRSDKSAIGRIAVVTTDHVASEQGAAPLNAGFFANAWHLFESVLDGIKPSLSARLILVGGAAADADPTDMHLALSHDRQSTRESNDSGN